MLMCHNETDIELAVHTIQSTLGFAEKELQNATQEQLDWYLEQVSNDLINHLRKLTNQTESKNV